MLSYYLNDPDSTVYLPSEINYYISKGATLDTIIPTSKMLKKEWYIDYIQGLDSVKLNDTNLTTYSLVEAFSNGNLNKLRHLLDKGIKVPKNLFYYGHTNKEVSYLQPAMKLILSYGFDINYIDPKLGFTVMQSYLFDYIARYSLNSDSYIKTLKHLQDLGADLHQLDHKGQNLADALESMYYYDTYGMDAYPELNIKGTNCTDEFHHTHNYDEVKKYLASQGVFPSKTKQNAYKIYKDYGKPFNCGSHTPYHLYLYKSVNR